MRVLLITAFYPPHHIGGWDQLVEDMNLRLRARGHVTQVLTSRHGVEYGTQTDGSVSRSLILDSDLYHYRPLDFFLKRRLNQRTNLRILRQTLDSFQPDVVFIHGMWLLWKGIPWYAEQALPGKVVYYMADDWPYARSIHLDYWQAQPNHRLLAVPKKRMANLAVRVLAGEECRYPLCFQRVLCVSGKVREMMIQRLGLSPEQLQVVYNGVELEQFITSAEKPLRPGNQLSLLYAGNMVEAKGVHTAIEAMRIVAGDPAFAAAFAGMTLTLVGSGHPDYEAYLHALVEKYHLADRVIISGRIPRGEMPRLLAQYDVLIFPSTGEALPRVVQEAMASGVVVIGTTVGGTGEILIEGETGLTFPVGDADRLAGQIQRLSQDPDLYQCLRREARDLAAHRFDLQKTMDDIETYLQQVAANDL